MLKLVGKSETCSRIFAVSKYLPIIYLLNLLITKGIIASLQWRSSADTTLTKGWRLRSLLITLHWHKVPPSMIHWEQNITSVVFSRKMYNLSYEEISEKPKLRDILSTNWPDVSKCQDYEQSRNCPRLEETTDVKINATWEPDWILDQKRM